MVKQILSEPLLHFLLIGAALFVLFDWRGSPGLQPGGGSVATSGRIVVSRDEIDQLVQSFARTWQRSPTEKEKVGLLESFVRDEIYYREAVAMGLERNDSVIRRRLRLKMEYIFEDIAAQGEPTAAELESYYRKNGDRYRLEPRMAFRQVYISAGTPEETAEARALRLLAELNNGSDPAGTGDPFLLGPAIDLTSLREIGQQFGARFTEGLKDLEPGSWQGPLRSGFGLHLVYVTEVVPERLPELREVRERVMPDWAADRQRELKDEAYARLRQRYTVEFESAGNPVAVKAGGVTGGTGTL